MNPKIKELYTQAHKEIIETNDYNGMGSVELEFDPEIFAELIVTECLSVIEQDLQYNQMILTSDTSYKIHNLASLTSVKSKIKQHFELE